MLTGEQGFEVKERYRKIRSSKSDEKQASKCIVQDGKPWDIACVARACVYSYRRGACNVRVCMAFRRAVYLASAIVSLSSRKFNNEYEQNRNPENPGFELHLPETFERSEKAYEYSIRQKLKNIMEDKTIL